MLNRPKPSVLMSLDGLGCSWEQEENAIGMVNTHCWGQLQKDYPMAILDSFCRLVGFPFDQMGNYEVGHIHNLLQDFFSSSMAYGRFC